MMRMYLALQIGWGRVHADIIRACTHKSNRTPLFSKNLQLST